MNQTTASVQPVASTPKASFPTPESPATRRKVYINGVEVKQVDSIAIEMNPYNRSRVTLQMSPKDVHMTEESIFIDIGGDKNKYTKKQLRDLIVYNLENQEAIKWIDRLKLNR